MSDWSHWLEAWLNGYIAAQDGQPEDETLLTAAWERFQQSGSERARREVEAMEAA